ARGRRHERFAREDRTRRMTRGLRPAARQPARVAGPTRSVVAAAPFVMPAWGPVAALVLATLRVQPHALYRLLPLDHRLPFRHAFYRFFALDDLILFQQAAGIRPWPATLWRWLSGWAWFRAVLPLWGHEPFPYHAASLALHLGNTVLLHRLARRWDVAPVGAF